jgi:hypothetical protein
VTVALPVFAKAAQRPELGMPQLPAGHRPLPLITDSESFARMSRFLLNIEKRSLPRSMLSGDGLASKDAV